MNIESPKQRINPKAIKAWRITGLVRIAPYIIGFIPLYIFVDQVNSVPYIEFYASGLAVLFFAFNFFLAKLRWERWQYEINEREIDLLRGVFVRKRTLVPINRIQHVDNRQGPIYKMFNLSSVSVSTAATTHVIPALDDATADEVRHNISNLVIQAKEDV